MQSIIKRALTLGAIGTLAVAGAAQAETDTTSAQLDAGTASMTAPTFSDFTNTTLNGSAQSKTTAVSDWAVNDARGNGAGWEVTMAASALSTGGGTPITMTGATVTVSAPDVAPTDVANTSTPPAVLGGDILAGSVKVADADAGEGLGAWSLSQGATDLALGIPADARAGAYTSTITTTFTPGV